MGFYQCQIEGLHHPLMTTIDYRGYRLTAMSILPLSFCGLVYGTIDYIVTVSLILLFNHGIIIILNNNKGSDDGGQEVHVDDPLMNQKMEQAAEKMNLKGHMAGMGKDKKFIYGPTDIEVRNTPSIHSSFMKTLMNGCNVYLC